MHVVCALVRLDYTCLRVALVLHWPAFQQHRLLWCCTGYYFVDDKRSHTAWRSSCAPDYTLFRCYLLTFKLAWLMWMAVLALLLWCFTGYHFTHFWSCGVSLATISLTTSVLILHGARPARPYTHISNSYCDFWVAPSLSFTHISKARGSSRPPWLALWLADWLAGWLAGWPVGWLAAWRPGCLAGWLAGSLAGWLAGWMADQGGRRGAGRGRGEEVEGQSTGREGEGRKGGEGETDKRATGRTRRKEGKRGKGEK